MHAPLITRSSTVSRAAPTRNFEYGEYENSLARHVFSSPPQTESDVATGITFETRFDEEFLLFNGQLPGLCCRGHLIFSRSIAALRSCPFS